METNKKEVIITAIICGSILALVLSLVIRNYALNDIELSNELFISKNRLLMTEKMVKDGHDPMVAGCSFVDKDNKEFCNDVAKINKDKEAMNLIKENK